MADSHTLQETQTIGIHDMLKGLQSIIVRFQTRSTICKFSDVTESFTPKEKDGLTSFLILNVLEAKIFQYNFWKDKMSEKMTIIHRQHKEM